MGVNTSTNMNLPIPQVGNEAGPQYATDVNNCLTLVDQHDHSPGYGVKVNPSGLDINSDLDFLDNDAVNLRSTRFFSNSSVLMNADDLDCLYVVDVDLYYNDGNGNNIRITQSGSVAGPDGSIANLVPPASASYSVSTGTFVWQSDVNKPAFMDSAALTIRNFSTGSAGYTLFPPVSLPSDVSVILPALPTAPQYVSIDQFGTMTAAAPSTLSKTANYTLTTSDYFIAADATGGAFQLSLPVVAGNSGRIYILKKTDSSANVVTIKASGSELIDGSNTQLLSTQNESYQIICDGSKWLIMDHQSISPWTSYTPTFSGGGTVTNISFAWRRVGANMQVRGSFTVGTTSGDFSHSLPSGYAISDTNAHKIAGGQAIIGMIINGNTGSQVQYFSGNYVGFAIYDGSDTGTAYLSINQGSNNFVKDPWNGQNNANGQSLLDIPISGWT